jgi:hypothetical protein
MSTAMLTARLLDLPVVDGLPVPCGEGVVAPDVSDVFPVVVHDSPAVSDPTARVIAASATVNVTARASGELAVPFLLRALWRA